MENSSRFFANRSCQYYPCHEGQEELNCLFCYCPMYLSEHCPGNSAWLDVGTYIIKDCSGCTFPHKAENYDAIIDYLRESGKKRRVSDEIRAKALRLKK
jgi:Zn-finger protein